MAATLSSGCSGKTDKASAGAGGRANAECVASGVCEAASCEHGCFDADRCASARITLWGGSSHEVTHQVAVTPDGERVVVGSVIFDTSTEDQSERDAFVAKIGPDGGELWSRQFGVPGTDEATDVTVDAAGNIYVTGASAGAFEGKPNTNPDTFDVFVLKLGPDGTTTWVTLFGGARNDIPNELALDADGNVHVAGLWNYGSGTREPFVASVGSDGTLIAVKTFESVPSGEAMTVDVDTQGNLYVTGEKESDNGYADVFAKKLSPDGGEVWSLEWATQYGDSPDGAVLDASGGFYVMGTTTGALGGNPAPALGSSSVFLSFVDASGTVSWTRTYYPELETRGSDVTLGENGDVLLAGSVLGAFTPRDDALEVDAFAMRLCPDGSPKGTLRWDLGHDDALSGIAEAPDGAIVLAGSSRYLDESRSDAQVYLISARPE